MHLNDVDSCNSSQIATRLDENVKRLAWRLGQLGRMFRLGYRTIALDVQDTLDLSFLTFFTGPCLTEVSRVLCLIASVNNQPKSHVTPDGRRSLTSPRVCERETWRTTKLVLFLSTFSPLSTMS